jgi:hypothetical protein
MGLKKHLVNGIISLVISVVVTVLTEDDDYEWNRKDALLAVAVSAFLSGAFTSYFAK